MKAPPLAKERVFECHLSQMGDHAYDLGYSGDRRGDAYMNALQPLLSSCPWLPIMYCAPAHAAHTR